MKNLESKLWILFLMVSSVAFSQITPGIDYDTNRDGFIDENEFNQGFAQNYDYWDTNQDDFIDEREFYDYSFRMLDRDRDMNLSQEEWERGYDEIYGDYLDDRDFNLYDRDRNQRISQDEFDRTMRDTYFYSDFDTNRDRRVDRDEFNKNVYSNMDRNQDGRIDRIEQDKLGFYYLERYE